MKAIVVKCVCLPLVVLSLGGCYTFRPADPSTIEPGMAVRVTISREEVIQQAEVLGGLVTDVQGTATEQTDDQALRLSFRTVGMGPNARFNSFLSVPWSGIEQVESKVFSTPRSIVAAALGAVITVAILAVTDVSGLGGEDEPPMNAFRLPLLRFIW